MCHDPLNLPRGIYSLPFKVSQNTPYSVRVQENTGQKKLRIWTLFTQRTILDSTNCSVHTLNHFKSIMTLLISKYVIKHNWKNYVIKIFIFISFQSNAMSGRYYVIWTTFLVYCATVSGTNVWFPFLNKQSSVICFKSTHNKDW